MTEVQRYQGKFIEKQREQKERAKQEQNLKKVEKAQPKEVEKEKSSKDTEEKISKQEANKLRKFLKNECEFRGYVETAKLMLKSKPSKTKTLAKSLLQVFRLSEDYDSDSDASDSDNEGYKKGYKTIVKKLVKSEKFQINDENQISLI